MVVSLQHKNTSEGNHNTALFCMFGGYIPLFERNKTFDRTSIPGVSFLRQIYDNFLICDLLQILKPA